MERRKSKKMLLFTNENIGIFTFHAGKNSVFQETGR